MHNAKYPFTPPWTHDSVRQLLAEKDAEHAHLKRALNTLAFYIQSLKEGPRRLPPVLRIKARRMAHRANHRANGGP